MKSNIFVLCLIAGIAVLLGIGLSVKITNDPIMAKLVRQQQEILGMQQKMVQQMAGEIGVDAKAKGSDRIKVLEDRIAALEKKIETMKLAQPMPPAPRQMGPPPEDFNKVYDIPIAKSPVRGKGSAPVTITGFLDLQCPFSARFQPVIDQALAAFPGKVKYVVKNFPLSFHPEAKPAAKAVLAASEQGKYWEMLDLILKDNRSLSTEKLKEFATTIKLDLKKFDADLKNKDAAYEKIIQDDFALGQTVDVGGTPTYFINGKKMMGPSLDVLKARIEEILK